MSTTPPPPPGATPPPPPGGGFAPAPAPAPAFAPATMPNDPSFWKKLFELDFRHFVTPSVVKVLYILWIVMASIYGLILLIAGLAGLGDTDGGSIIFVLLAPIGWFLMVVYGRVIIEVFIALIRTAQNTTILVDRQGPGSDQPPRTF
jgi:hypothetical protein